MSRPLCETNRRWRRMGALVVVAFAAAGCVQKMSDQPRIDSLEGSAFFSDGLGARPQVAGTIAQGQSIDDGPAATGKEDGQPVKQIPVEVTQELLDRGRERFGIYCSHCHGPSGYGDGPVVQRGFPKPPSYHIERLRNAPDGHLFAVITDGFGKMPSFRARIEPHDRWAIVSYVRALELSQYAEVDQLSEEDRKRIEQIKENSPLASREQGRARPEH